MWFKLLIIEEMFGGTKGNASQISQRLFLPTMQLI